MEAEKLYFAEYEGKYLDFFRYKIRDRSRLRVIINNTVIQNCQDIYNKNNKIYAKVYLIDELDVETLQTNLDVYKDIDHLDIAPKFIECKQILKLRLGYLSNGNKYYEDDRLGAVHVIINERYGISVAEKYLGF
jgi:hypothetical protein